jgi:hypothetical protein
MAEIFQDAKRDMGVTASGVWQPAHLRYLASSKRIKRNKARSSCIHYISALSNWKVL